MTLDYKSRGSGRLKPPLGAVDWKSTVVCNRFAFLFVDVLPHHLIREVASTHRQIATCPEMLSPKLLPQPRKLLQQDPRADALKPLHYLADSLRRPIRHQHVNMVVCDFPADYL